MSSNYKDTNHQVLIRFPQNLLKQGGGNIGSEIHKLINSIWNKEELPEEWKESIIVPIYKKGVGIEIEYIYVTAYAPPRGIWNRKYLSNSRAL